MRPGGHAVILPGVHPERHTETAQPPGPCSRSPIIPLGGSAAPRTPAPPLRGRAPPGRAPPGRPCSPRHGSCGKTGRQANNPMPAGMSQTADHVALDTVPLLQGLMGTNIGNVKHRRPAWCAASSTHGNSTREWTQQTG